MCKEFIVPIVARKNQFKKSIESPDNHLSICVELSRSIPRVMEKYVDYCPEILPITKFESNLFKIDNKTQKIKFNLNELVNSYTVFNTRINKNYNQIFVNKFISRNKQIFLKDEYVDLTDFLFSINSFVSNNMNFNCIIVLKGSFVYDEPFPYKDYDSQFINLLSEPWFLKEELYCLGFASIHIKNKEFIEFVKDNLFNIYYRYRSEN